MAHSTCLLFSSFLSVSVDCPFLHFYVLRAGLVKGDWRRGTRRAGRAETKLGRSGRRPRKKKEKKKDAGEKVRRKDGRYDGRVAGRLSGEFWRLWHGFPFHDFLLFLPAPSCHKATYFIFPSEANSLVLRPLSRKVFRSPAIAYGLSREFFKSFAWIAPCMYTLHT